MVIALCTTGQLHAFSAHSSSRQRGLAGQRQQQGVRQITMGRALPHETVHNVNAVGSKFQAVS